MNKEESKKRIAELVERYNTLVAEGKEKEYNEADTRKDFIEPLFQALGWDVRNKEEVAAEETMSKGRVDYSFRINGIPKFYLEAKPLKKELEEKDIYQAINYSYVQGCSWAVLTNFKRIEVYNAEWKEKNPGKVLFFALNVKQFSTDERLFLLSKESFEEGIVDQEAEKWGKKTKKIPIDKQLLNDLTNFRELLSKNILKNNASENLTEEQLDESVQRILDRLIFIRYVEDRGFEPPKLQTLVREESNKKLYKRLNEVYRNIGIPYNSILFISHLCDDLLIDDEVLEKVINGLFKTADETVRYDFEIISADVLGNVYEQYLGHILKKTDKRAKLTEGKVHRKEQGIYYTPTYIVDYIVKNTLGELLKDKNVDVSKIRILDPACGSGSFLIKAFDVLEEYYDKHNKKYSDAKKSLDFPRISRVKTDIVLNNLHGVDLDSRAIEIAQLNLLLKMTEKRQKLPLLHHNIKCGNSLIDDPEVAGEKFAFKWDEQFQEIMEDGGFDVVVGNPPYIDYREIEGTEFIKKKFYSAQVKNKYNILILFLEQGLKLLKERGFLGFIVSNQFLCSDFGLNIRKFILENSKINQIIDVSMMKVFRDASTYPIIIIIEKTKPRNNIIKVAKPEDETKLINRSLKFDEISQEIYSNIDKNLFLLELGKGNLNIISKMKENSRLLKDCVEEITWGTSATGYGKKKIKQDEFFSLPKKEQGGYMKIIQTADIQRYRISWQKEFITKKIYTENKLRLFYNDKIVIGRLNKFLKATIDMGKYVLGKATLIIPKKDMNIKFLLALLNSKVIDYYFKLLFKSTHMSQGYLRYDVPYLEQLPIKNVSESQQQPLIKLVDKMLSLNKRLNELGDKKTNERERIEREIKETDKEIDELVYKIYSITEEEKKVIEGSSYGK